MDGFSIARFLRCSSYFACTFSGEIVLLYVHRKKAYCSIFSSTIFVLDRRPVHLAQSVHIHILISHTDIDNEKPWMIISINYFSSFLIAMKTRARNPLTTSSLRARTLATVARVRVWHHGSAHITSTTARVTAQINVICAYTRYGVGWREREIGRASCRERV